MERSPEYHPADNQKDDVEDEQGIDLRRKNEIFRDHERLRTSEDEAMLKLARDQLVEETDGVMHITLEAYRYDFRTNPFVVKGPRGVHAYAIARYLDVTFLHRFMYQDILVCGIRSREFVDERGRANFIKHLRETGGNTIRGATGYDFLALQFSPYVEYHSTLPTFTHYHEQAPHAATRPHYPVDVWVIYDANAYERTSDSPRANDPRVPYRLKRGYERARTVLGVAQIN